MFKSLISCPAPQFCVKWLIVDSDCDKSVGVLPYITFML